MASGNSSVQQQQQQQPQQQQQEPFLQSSSNPYQCVECGLHLNSAESLDVHLRYHKETLLHKWATQAATSQSEETNNNNSKTVGAKREFIPNTIAAPADSSDAMVKKSPEYGSRTTPETSVNFGHPLTPQSYHSASSPYQNNDNSTFSPGFQNYQSVKIERISPNSHFQQNYQSFPDNQFFNMENSQPQASYSQEYTAHNKISTQNSQYRYHPYQQQSPYNRTQPLTQMSSSSPTYPPQPTPSPSPKQCEKCGFVCGSAAQLMEHVSIAHSQVQAAHMAAAYQQNQHFMFANQQEQTIKKDEEAQSEILDLDSHKVHQVYQEDEKRQNGDLNGHNPNPAMALLTAFAPPKMFTQEHRMYVNCPELKMVQNGMADGKIFQPHQLSSPPEYLTVTTTTQENHNSGGITTVGHGYRPFEHLPPQPNPPVVTSAQLSNNAAPTGTTSTKSANWKSNEARRPKTYNCTACNKWFTSSGHLKRHYNTTLHKNAVKSSGQPDPATMPISAHHHPARDSASTRGEDVQSGSPNEDSRGDDSIPPQFDRTPNLPGLIQQPPNGPYDRQPPPNIHHAPLHSPMTHNPNSLSNPLVANPSSLSNLSGSSPPNGEAGLSATNIDSRGLLSLSTPSSTPHGFSMGPPMMQMENNQFQMYPNGSAPHVTQITATNSLNTTGEYQYASMTTSDSQQPLPSFAQIHQAHRYGILFEYGAAANVGGGGPVTAPYTYYTEPTYESLEPTALIFRQDDEDYKLTILTAVDQAAEDEVFPGSPTLYNNNNNGDSRSPDIQQKRQQIIENERTKIPEGDNIIIRYEAQRPRSPENAKTKSDYEENTGSPVISSTVQTKQPGINKCFDCDKVFNKACYLTQHNKTFHSGDKPFKCTRCGKRFSCENQYQDHLSKHAGDKPYKCDLCPKQFNHKTDLRRHMCLHTGQKPYTCETCGKGFIRKDHMLKHCETHTRKPHMAKVAAVR